MYGSDLATDALERLRSALDEDADFQVAWAVNARQAIAASSMFNALQRQHLMQLPSQELASLVSRPFKTTSGRADVIVEKGRPESSSAASTTSPLSPQQSPSMFGGEHVEDLQLGSPPHPQAYTFPATMLLQSKVGSSEQVLFSRTFSTQSHQLPFFDYRDLQGAVTAHFEQGGSTPISAVLTTSLTPYTSPIEAQLYARNPEDVAAFLDSLPTDPDVIRAVVSTPENGGGVLPDAVAMLSPPTPSERTGEPWAPHTIYGLGADPNATVLDPLRTIYFYKGALPEYIDFDANYQPRPLIPPTGAVQAIKVQQIGACSVEQGYQDLFDNFGAMLQAEVQDCTTTVHAATVVPMVRQDGRVQIFMNLHLTGSQSVAAIEFGCEVRASVIYELGLDNGALVVRLAQKEELGTGAMIDQLRIENVGGNGCQDVGWGTMIIIEGADSRIEKALRGVPAKLNASLREQQIFPPSGSTLPSLYESSPGTEYQLAALFPGFRYGGCTPSELQPDPTLINAYDNNPPPPEWYSGGADMCSEARDDLCKLVRFGFRRLVLNDQSPYSLSDIVDAPGCELVDDPRLAELFSAINEMTGSWPTYEPRLAHWNCQYIDESRAFEIGGYTSIGEFPEFRNPTDDEKAQMSRQCSPPGFDATNISARIVHMAPPPPHMPSWMHTWTYVWSFTCPSPDMGVCVFVPPIRRLIANPDSVIAVLLETDPAAGVSTYRDGALAMRFMLEALAHATDAPAGSSSLIQKLCAYVRPNEDVFWRPFNVWEATDLACKPGPTAPPRPKNQCGSYGAPCGGDGECCSLRCNRFVKKFPHLSSSPLQRVCS